MKDRGISSNAHVTTDYTDCSVNKSDETWKVVLPPSKTSNHGIYHLQCERGISATTAYICVQSSRGFGTRKSKRFAIVELSLINLHTDKGAYYLCQGGIFS